MTRINILKHGQEQDRLRAQDAHAACYSIAQAAGFLHLHRDSINEMILKRGLGHRTSNGRTAPWHLTLQDLHAAYPFMRRRYRRAEPVTTKPLSKSEYAETAPGAVQVSGPDFPEYRRQAIADARQNDT